jgi:hypothetical protein
MNINTILLIIIIIYLIFLNYKEKYIEKFAEIDDITAAVKEIYNTDINHIRTLSKISREMYNNNTLNINGDLIVDGDITCNHNITFKAAADKGFSRKSFIDVNNIIDGVNANISNINYKYKDGKDRLNNYKKAVDNKIKLNSPVEFTYNGSKLSFDPSNINNLQLTTTSGFNTKWIIKQVKLTD